MTRRKDLTSETAQDKFNVEAEARRRGIEPYQVRALTAVDDKLIADIVNDFYRRPVGHSASMIPDKQRAEPVTKGSNGWRDAAPLKGPDTRWVDRQLDAQAERERVAKLREAAELAWIKSQLEESESRVQSEYNPFDAEHMKK